MNIRVENLRRELGKRKLDTMLISCPANRRYLSGFTGSDGFLLVSRKQAILAVDFRYTEQARRQAPDFEVYQIYGGYTQWLPELVERLKVGRIGYEADDLSVSSFREMAKAVKSIPGPHRPSVVSTRSMVESLRAVKDTLEIQRIEKAADLADRTIVYARDILEPGITERHLAWELEKFLKENKSESLPFDIIIASGPNAALPHAQPGERVIGQYDPVVIDLGARLEGYTSDMTRTICCGKTDDTFEKIYHIVRQAQLAAINSIKPGISGSEADSLARKVIEEAGYGNAFGHGLGHGVGLQTHEAPSLGPRSGDLLREGMVFTIEPGIYVSGWGGVRIEDMILLEGGRARLLTNAPK